MSRPLLVLRPEPGNGETCTQALDRGIEPIGIPLFTVEPVAWSADPPASYAGILLTSANAVRHAGDLSDWLTLPVYAVGGATAAAAREAGFESVVEGDRDVARLIAKVATLGKHRLLHLAGEDWTAFDPGPIEIDRRIAYRAVEIAAPAGLTRALAAGPVALLHSVRAAHRLAACADGKDRIVLVAISNAVAQAAGPGWREVAIAPLPRNDAMLEIAAQYCR